MSVALSQWAFTTFKVRRTYCEISRASRTNDGKGGPLGSAKSLAQFLQQRYGVELGVRRCRRLFRKPEFRLRKPRPEIARADPERQRVHKKNSGPG